MFIFSKKRLFHVIVLKIILIFIEIVGNLRILDKYCKECVLKSILWGNGGQLTILPG